MNADTLAAFATLSSSPECAAYLEALGQWLTDDERKKGVLDQTAEALCQRARTIDLLPEHVIIALGSTGSAAVAASRFGGMTPVMLGREEHARRYHLVLDALLSCCCRTAAAAAPERDTSRDVE